MPQYPAFIGVKLTSEQKEKFLQVCDDRAATPSRLARKIISDWLATNQTTIG